MRPLSYLAYLGALEGVAFLVVILVRKPRPPGSRAFAVMAVAYAVQALGSVFVLGADDGSWITVGRVFEEWGLGAVGASAAALIVAHHGNRIRRIRRVGVALGCLAGWAILSLFAPWVASGLLLGLSFLLLSRPDRLSPWERQLQEVVSDAVLFLDQGHRIVGANPAAHRRHPGLQPGQDIFELVDTPELLQAQWARVEARSDLGPPLRLRLGGAAVTLVLSPHYDRFGDVVGAVVLLTDPGGSLPEKGLSPREAEVADLVVQGLTNKAIADRLFLSEGTVKRHLHSILAKTGVSRREELRMLRAGVPQ